MKINNEVETAAYKHREFATLAERAERIIEGMDFPNGQIAASKRIREQLKADDISVKIDALARKILPYHITLK